MNTIGASSLGVPELVVVLVIAVIWVVPVAAAVWALVTLHRIRTTQAAIHTRLGAIEQLLQRH